MNLSFEDKLLYDKLHEVLKRNPENQHTKIIWEWMKEGIINLRVFKALIPFLKGWNNG